MVRWVVGKVVRTQVEVGVDAKMEVGVDAEHHGVGVVIGNQLVGLVGAGQEMVRLRGND